MRFFFELFDVLYIVFGMVREGVYEFGEKFFEWFKEEYGIDLCFSIEKDVLIFFNEFEKMEVFYIGFGFFEDFEEVMDIRKVVMEFFEKLKNGK